MTDQLRQAAQQALEALEGELWLMLDKPEDEQYRVKYAYLLTVITALREALAQEHAMHDLVRLGQEIEQGKRGSIALARQLCYQINGAADDSDDMDGGGYGSVDIAEILSAEVVRLQAALAQLEQQAAPQRAWVGVTEKDWEYVKDKKGTSLDSFDQGAAWAADQLMRRNT